MRPFLPVLLLVPLLACSAAPPAATAKSEPEAHATAKPKAAAGSYRDATIDDLEKALPAAHLVDVRTPGEYERGHVASARLIPLNELPQRIGELDAWRGQELWVICQSGGRSAKAGQLLRSKGFTVVNVQGGTGAWMAAGKPVKAGAAE